MSMFHTFELCNSSPQPKPQEYGKLQQSTLLGDRRACEECCRRKIRCDRLQPCGACVYYKNAHFCRYKEKRFSSRRLSAVGLQYRAVLKRLFPTVHLESLFDLTRDQLLNMLLFDQTDNSNTVSQTPPGAALTSQAQADIDNDTHGEESCLEVLEIVPVQPDLNPDYRQDLVNSISDDINSLYPVVQSCCYLGVSSISAVMKVMIWIDPSSLSCLFSEPRAKVQFNQATNFRDRATENHISPISHSSGFSSVTIQEDTILDFNAGLELVDAFFDRIHPLFPILDEVGFRAMYQSGNRHDDRWKALLNTVFALGSISLRPAGDRSHVVYFQHAKAVIGLEYFAHPHIESVQTLGLLAGHYLHYISQPHLAYSLMGVAVRMAAALGLHKEQCNSSGPSADLGRRVWWSLFCLDTFGCMTLGRPTFGRFGPSISIKPPTLCGSDRSLAAVSLVENTRFCIIATQIQEILATSPGLPYDQMADLDKKLVDWYERLPSLLTNTTEAPTAFVSTIRQNIQWRYLNCRMLLYRPALLSYAMRRTKFSILDPKERHAVLKCCLIAKETITCISNANVADPTAAWGSVWFIFQAVLVPLLVLFVNDETFPFDQERKGNIPTSRQDEIRMAITTLSRLEDWTPTARQTVELVSMLDAARRKLHKPCTNESRTCRPHSTDPECMTSFLEVIPGKSAPHAKSYSRTHSFQQIGSEFSTQIPTPVDVISLDPAVDGFLPPLDSSTNFPNTLAEQEVWDYIAWAETLPWAVEPWSSGICADFAWLWPELQ